MFRRRPPIDPDPFEPLYCSTVMVAMTNGSSLRGVLWDRRGPLLVLRNAELIEPVPSGGVSRQALDGDQVVIERAKVDFIQVITTSVEV